MATTSLSVNLEDAEFIALDPIIEEGEEKFNGSPRSTSVDHGHPNFPCTKNTTRRSSTCRTSLSRFRLPDYPRCRLVNMLIKSKKELSHHIDSLKYVQSDSVSTPFNSKSPLLRRKSYTEPFPFALTEDETGADQLLLIPFQGKKTTEEREGLLSSDQVVFQEKLPKSCTIKIPDLSVVEEESSGGTGSPSEVNDPMPPAPFDPTSSPSHNLPLEAYSSLRSLTSSIAKAQ